VCRAGLLSTNWIRNPGARSPRKTGQNGVFREACGLAGRNTVRFKLYNGYGATFVSVVMGFQ
jgi:hypothetical protein